ncbi:SusC/RagA family TonB-linked outer membrane protein [Sphingobacterium sp. SGR-19]|nr:SusC/RagA family TonB-linked outer membrane protein [Sphingobacterium sp. SGR-19]NGM67322.1 SusC/RagA family TonB-linked outer membrane protein [Sphingobacterium sp. SGR-19]
MKSYLVCSNSEPRVIGVPLVILMVCFMLFNLSDAWAQSAETRAAEGQKRILVGEVRSATDGKAVEGVSLRISGTSARTDEEGKFQIQVTVNTGKLDVRHIGFQPQLINFNVDTKYLEILLEPLENQIEEVEVVSTGYQQLPKERATGSFVQIDNELLNRRVSTNLLDRLDGVASGLQFRTSSSGSDRFNPSFIQIRGRSTLNANHQPLIVVDNFAYDGDISSINPNDVESITILKDAAAASAWGARSGNGVIVIKTKEGARGRPTKIALTSNFTVGAKPDLYAPSMPQLSSAQYIEVEQFLFDQGAYNTRIRNGWQGISPAVDIFRNTRDNVITSSDSLRMINELKKMDARSELLSHYYRQSLQQQYNVNFSGGGDNNQFFISGGYDDNRNNVVNSYAKRYSINANHAYFFFDERMKVTTNLVMTSSKSGAGAQVSNLYPYDRLTNDQGQTMAITNANGLSHSFTDTFGNGKLLDWKHRPIDELGRGSTLLGDRTEYRLNTAIDYRFTDYLKASVRYGFEKGVSESVNYNGVESFYARDMINRFATVDATSGEVTFNLPVGGISNNTTNAFTSSNGRVQLDFAKNWGKHELNAIAGSEVKDVQTNRSGVTYYGHDPLSLANQNASIDFSRIYNYSYGSGSGRISTGASQYNSVDRFFSYFTNASYTFDRRYTISGSARRDESNLFGVATNQKGVPLWSAGLAWTLSNEKFFHVPFIDLFRVRTTYGYTGNVDRSLSAYLTANSASHLITSYNQLYADIVNPPNPSLRWERVGNLNMGVDLRLLSGRLSLTADYWRKRGADLIGPAPIAPQTGVSTFTGNTASTSSRGLDIELTSVNLDGKIKWSSTVLFNIAQDKVTEYLLETGSNFTVISNPNANPLVDYPYWALFSYRYKGLDTEGNPIGYLDGQESIDYNSIVNNLNREDMVYSGSRVPTHFGSFRNTLSYGAFDLSFNIVYKFGVVFRRASLDNSSLYGSGGAVTPTQADYEQRWQQPGDELRTVVPAMIYPANGFRSRLYAFSESLVESAANIRLQDIRLGYTLKKIGGLSFTNLNIFTYVNNLGILWRKNNYGIDPDYPTSFPQPRTYAFGIQAQF